MNVRALTRSLYNDFDFVLRNLFRFQRQITTDEQLPAKDLLLQLEFEEFLKLFHWEQFLPRNKNILTVVDIGARNFLYAPVYEKFFEHFANQIILHGIEVDAYRRFLNFRTRYDYGIYYAKKVKNGKFHACDFLSWKMPVDIAFLLNPFVTPSPLLAWGLPLRFLRPKEIFSHAKKLLTPGGILLVSGPDEEELQLSKQIALELGMTQVAKGEWFSSPKSKHQMDRLGLVFQN